MRGYGQFCPVALGAEVFAERWTPLILRELLAGSHRFSELQRGLPGIPRALLTQRLGSLQRAGLVERRPARAGRGFEYHLSPAGLSFSPVVEALGRWGYQWAAEQLRPDNLDAGLLMWFLRRRVQVDRLPAEQVTVQFEFRDADKRCFWLVLPREQAAATPPSGVAAEVLARGTIAQPGGSTGWHVHPGPALVTVKTGRLTLHRAKGCRTRAFNAGQTFLELGPDDVNLTRNETGGVTETVVTFLLPVGAPVTVDAPAPRHCPL